MTPPVADIAIELSYDSRLFLPVPAQVRAGAGASSWVKEQVQVHGIGALGTAESIAVQLASLVGALSAEAFAAFLFCPQGLPGSALVEIFIVRADGTMLPEIEGDDTLLLPRRTRATHSASLGEGRVISSLDALDDGSHVGQLRYLHRKDGLLIDMSVTSMNLGVLGASTSAFDELVGGIVITQEAAAS